MLAHIYVQTVVNFDNLVIQAELCQMRSSTLVLLVVAHFLFWSPHVFGEHVIIETHGVEVQIPIPSGFESVTIENLDSLATIEKMAVPATHTLLDCFVPEGSTVSNDFTDPLNFPPKYILIESTKERLHASKATFAVMKDSFGEQFKDAIDNSNQDFIRGIEESANNRSPDVLTEVQETKYGGEIPYGSNAFGVLYTARMKFEDKDGQSESTQLGSMNILLVKAELIYVYFNTFIDNSSSVAQEVALLKSDSKNFVSGILTANKASESYSYREPYSDTLDRQNANKAMAVGFQRAVVKTIGYMAFFFTISVVVGLIRRSMRREKASPKSDPTDR